MQQLSPQCTVKLTFDMTFLRAGKYKR